MKLSKACKKLPADVLEEIFEKGKEDPQSLHRVVSSAEAAIAKATKERDANPEYQKAKQACKDLSEGLKDVREYQKAKATVALALLDEANLAPDDDEALDKARETVHREQTARKRAS